MNKFVAHVLAVVLFFSCSNHKNDDQKENKEVEKKITKRDYSITPQNSYTDLFLDSVFVEKFITDNHLNDALTRRIRSFYNARNFQLAWFCSTGLTEQGRSFWNLHEYDNTYSKDKSLDDKALRKTMTAFAEMDSFKLTTANAKAMNTELLLTVHFIDFILKNYQPGDIKRKETEKFVPSKKQDALFLADSLLSKKHKDNKYYSDVNLPYKLLKQQLEKYVAITKNKGWQTIVYKGKPLAKGMKDPVIVAVKNRLHLSGELPQADTTLLFTNELVSAVKSFQSSHGYTPGGTVNAALVKELNVPALKRVEQILINMNRMRWMLNDDDGNLAMVNIPEFVLHVYEGKHEAFNMPVVVGKEGHNTTIFTGILNQVVFSPYWNVTQNIVVKEIWPKMKRDRSYLQKNNMEQTGSDEDGVPVIRQLPGEKNSLGKVKFLFPNSYDIYFHDTPAKDLFRMDKRAYSHGCIRLGDPVKMAAYLLRNQKEWTAAKIDSAMNSGAEQMVKLKNPVPVLITYYTAWVDDKGILNFRDDVYGHDAMLMRKMFVNN